MGDYVSLSEKVARSKVYSTVAEFRYQIGRVFFFAILVANGRTEEEREYYRRLMGVAKAGVDEACTALLSGRSHDGLDARALAWARDRAASIPDLTANMTDFHRVVETAIRMMEEEPGDLIPFLLDITDKADKLFGGTFAELLGLLQADLADADDGRLAAAAQATEGARAAMGQIDAISRSVRLISLNAAVEAARVGDSGRGFSVIAGEIKTLAEAIATASHDAGRSMDELREVAAG